MFRHTTRRMARGWQMVMVAGMTLLLLGRQVGAQTNSASARTATASGTNETLLTERSGTITLKVANYDTMRRQVLDALVAQGGTLEQARTTIAEKGRQRGWLRVRVPADHLEPLLNDLRKTGILYAETMHTDDHTHTFSELARRAERLRQHERRLNGLLNSGRNLRGNDLLFLQERLFRAAVDESLLEQQRDDIQRDVQTARLQIELFEPLPTPSGNVLESLPRHFNRARGYAWLRLNRMATQAATGTAYALVFAPFWLPCLVVAIVALRVLWVRRNLLAGFVLRSLQAAQRNLAALQARWNDRTSVEGNNANSASHREMLP